MDLQLTDKVAIVTGSSRGLGFATAAALIDEGCRVTICARGGERLGNAADELRRRASGSGMPSGDRLLSVEADLSTPDGVERVVERTVATFGGLDILVNNVGVARGSSIVDTTD